MRILLLVLGPAVLLGCAAAGVADPEHACRAQGYAPGELAWEFCMDAGGVAIATGPGSPYAAWNLEE